MAIEKGRKFERIRATTQLEHPMTAKKPIRPKTPFVFHLSATLDQMRRAYEAGVPAALYDAVSLLRDLQLDEHENRPIPIWVWDAILETVECRLGQGVPTGPGRTGNEKSKQRHNLIHCYRFHAVRSAKENGATWEKAYEQAQKDLMGTFAQGNPGAMKASYSKVKRSLDDPKEQHRFYLARFPAREIVETS